MGRRAPRMVTTLLFRLFVGTKKQAKAVVKEVAEECGEFYICERWLGGTLTNLQTIRNSVKTLERIEKRIASGAWLTNPGCFLFLISFHNIVTA